MKITLSSILISFALLFATNLYAYDVLLSPNGTIKVVVVLSGGKLNYFAQSNSQTVISGSALGINTTKADFTSDLTYVSSTPTTINETYQLPSGKSSTYVNNCNELDVKLMKGTNEFHVIFRAYNDGIAYKYYIPGTGTTTVNNETSEIIIAGFEKCWGQQFIYDYSTKYPERDWTAASAIASFCAPILCKTGNNWCLISEAANYGTYCVSALTPGLVTEPGKFTFQIKGTLTPTLPLTTPWRTAIIGSLPTVTESVLIENLNPATEIADVSWIKPGKASWDWGGQEAKSPWNTLPIAKMYVDLAFNMGWDYFMLDDGWESAVSSGNYQLSDIVSYANTKGIGVLLWTNSNRFQNDAAQIRPILQGWKDLGFKGIKVDFWKDNSQAEMQKYDKVISIAAELKLMVNLHGCVLPSGVRRRWPNLITSEAVYGGEQYMFSWNATPADHNINLVFTRNVVGPMDYTPTDLLWADQTLRTLTTWSHQLALVTIYESGIQHFIDCPNSYLNNVAGGYLKDLPVTWDETKLVGGELNQYAAVARRKGANWYVAGLCNNARSLNVNLSFLEDGKTYYAQINKDGIADFDIRYEEVKVKKGDLFSVAMRAHGGATVRISENPIERPAFDTYEAEAATSTLTGSAAVTSNTKYSNNACVSGIGPGSTLKINKITASKAGKYVMALYYNSNTATNTYVKVNNQASVIYAFPQRGNLTLQKFDITLNAGDNSISFGNDAGTGINIDKIIINPNLAYNNVGVTEITTPQSAVGLSATEAITVKVKNESLNAQVNVPISYTIDNSTPVTELIPSIPAQSVINYSFTKTADLHKGIAAYKILVKTALSGDTHSFDDTLSVVVNNTLNTTAVKDVIENGMRVYPSVTNAVVHIKLNKMYTQPQLSILDVSGRVIYKSNSVQITQDTVYDIDMTNYPVGIYVLKLASLEGSCSMKIIRKGAN